MRLPLSYTLTTSIRHQHLTGIYQSSPIRSFQYTPATRPNAIKIPTKETRKISQK